MWTYFVVYFLQFMKNYFYIYSMDLLHFEEEKKHVMDLLHLIKIEK